MRNFKQVDGELVPLNEEDEAEYQDRTVAASVRVKRDLSKEPTVEEQLATMRNEINKLKEPSE